MFWQSSLTGWLFNASLRCIVRVSIVRPYLSHQLIVSFPIETGNFVFGISQPQDTNCVTDATCWTCRLPIRSPFCAPLVLVIPWRHETWSLSARTCKIPFHSHRHYQWNIQNRLAIFSFLETTPSKTVLKQFATKGKNLCLIQRQQWNYAKGMANIW